MATELRATGIDIVGAMPWGTHFCLFYETKRDLLEALVPYFRAGLENREFCLWVVSTPLTVVGARTELGRAIPDLDRFLAEGAMEIVSSRSWYLKGGTFASRRVMKAWDVKLGQALAKGFVGMRVNGHESWLKRDDWEYFRDYEREINTILGQRRMLVLCSYPIARSGAGALLDVARTHQFAVAIRNGEWQVVETPELKQAKAAIAKLNEGLERRVAERTSELATTNEELRREITERQRAEEQIRDYEARLRSLASELVLTEERERRRVAVTLHDTICQSLALAKIKLAEFRKTPQNGEAQLNGSVELIEMALQQVRALMSELSPPALYTLGFKAAVEGLAEQVRHQYKIRVELEDDRQPKPLGEELRVLLFTAVRELIVNVLKHARARTIRIGLQREGETVRISVADDGIGFDVHRLGFHYDETGGFGLFSIHERLAYLGGQCVIDSRAGRGTRVTLIAPLATEDRQVA